METTIESSMVRIILDCSEYRDLTRGGLFMEDINHYTKEFVSVQRTGWRCYTILEGATNN